MFSGSRNVITGEVAPPEAPASGSSNDIVTAYNAELVKFDRLDAVAVTILTTAMNKEICATVMINRPAKDIWNKLLSIFEQKSGQRLDLLISQLFNYRKAPSDSTAQHVAKLETLWMELC